MLNLVFPLKTKDFEDFIWYLASVLWFIHTARDRDRNREQDCYNRKQWIWFIPCLWPAWTLLYNILEPINSYPVPCTGPVKCEYAFKGTHDVIVLG